MHEVYTTFVFRNLKVPLQLIWFLLTNGVGGPDTKESKELLSLVVCEKLILGR